MATSASYDLKGPIERDPIEMELLELATIEEFNDAVVKVLNGQEKTIKTIYGEGTGAKLKRKGNSGCCCYSPPAEPQRVSTSVWSGVKGFFKVPFTSFPCSQSVHNRWHYRVGENLGEILGKRICQLSKDGLLNNYLEANPLKKEGNPELNKIIHKIANCLEDFNALEPLTGNRDVVIIPSGHLMFRSSARGESTSKNPKYPIFSMEQVRSSTLPIGMQTIVLKHHLQSDCNLNIFLSSENRQALSKTAIHLDQVIFHSFQAEHAEMIEDLQQGIITPALFKTRREEMISYLRESGNGAILQSLGWQSSSESKRQLQSIVTTLESSLIRLEEEEREEETSDSESD